MEALASIIQTEQFYRAGMSMTLAIARPLAFLFLMPFISQYNLTPGPVQFGVATVLAIPAMPMIYFQLGAYPGLTFATITLLFIKEFIIGIFVVLPLALPFWVAATAGGIVEQLSGLGAATEGKEYGGAFSDYFIVILTVILLTHGLLTSLVFASLYDSYSVWPVLSIVPQFDERLFAFILGVLDRIMTLAIVFALPFVATFFLIDIIAGLSFKYTPQFNPMTESATYKTFVLTLILVPMTFILLAQLPRYLPQSAEPWRGLISVVPMEVPDGR